MSEPAPIVLTEAERERLDFISFADDVANEVVDWFSTLHPSILMSYGQWTDLKEMIRRETAGIGNGAKDLVPDSLKP